MFAFFGMPGHLELIILAGIVCVVVMPVMVAAVVVVVLLATRAGRKAADGSETIPCPDCGQPVSPQAAACPHCGRERSSEVSG